MKRYVIKRIKDGKYFCYDNFCEQYVSDINYATLYDDDIIDILDEGDIAVEVEIKEAR